MGNSVFIATSIDGFIAKSDGSLDWLTGIDNRDNQDYGYSEFMNKIDAVVMGRNTFEFVSKMKVWPYQKPVIVLSSNLNPDTECKNDVKVLNAGPKDVVSSLNTEGYNNLYVDGGKTIQGFLAHGLIDELIITRIPVILGTGIPLFNNIKYEQKFAHLNTTVYGNGLIKSSYRK